MLNWLRQLLGGRNARSTPIPDALWQATLAAYPFLADRPPADLQQLRALVGEFLAQKEFSGAHGLLVSDEMAVAIAAQACLPVLHLGLDWYSDFVGIVVHPGQMLARRETQDASGVVHRYSEVLAGEAMDRGPVTLSWQDVASAGEQAGQGYNVVIHEFVHKIDMKNGVPDGCPPLGSRAAHAAWHAVMQPAYDAFREQVTIAERFGGQPPWLDAYGATAPAEFFAVACEAYFVNRARFTQDFAALTPLFDQFFRINRAAAL
ncbi:MAG: zinc-dependent peptidase [Hydrogenophaga sp.]|uniref:M90 family metallopeptidase n=1 Tax=Polaromonas sp. TaxID=1869339 RepID=UPI00273143E4|nr:M90 family metallopeptidase [Polaromonas sp.]MDP1742544.1 zinc-dependent peptidase [Polaromonas sp.]MDP1954912.1 zinc-dependent peptidase [Polaromonas sp.]MDP3166675.1 zinc-dependent peptidase [Hydrogenophaga sp.]MDP3752419.1 zinc-dependent peptidase [Polaromonas sp.]